MTRLTTLTKLCRNYLFSNPEAIDRQYVSDIKTRLQIITDSREQLLDALLKEDSEDVNLVKDCKDEIKYQLKMLDDFIEEFTEYCIGNGLDIEKKDVSDSLNLHMGIESDLYIICSEWEIIGIHARTFISQMDAVWPTEDLHVLYAMQEKMISCFMDTYRIIDKEMHT